MSDFNSFSALFKKFRLKAEFASLSEFGKALADEGYIYEDSIFSRWQSGHRIPHSRSLLLTIVKIFINRGSVTSAKEVNLFLESAGQGYITNRELHSFTSLTHIDL